MNEIGIIELGRTIGECTRILSQQLWGKTLVKGQLKSRKWWEYKLQIAINSPDIIIDEKDNLKPGIYSEDGSPIPSPIPLENEYPELAEHLRKISNGEHSLVESINITNNGSTVSLKDGRLIKL